MEELERKIEEPGFWDNADESQHVMKELKGLKDLIEKADKLSVQYEEMGLLIEMALLVVRTALGTFVALLGSHMIVVEFVEKSSIACCSYRDQLLQK